MKILLINPPHTAIGSRIPKEHLPPLGLLCIGGPLLDAGHQVKLLNADIAPMTNTEVLVGIFHYQPQAVLIGQSGSTSAHPKVAELSKRIREEFPNILIIYGGVFPTYHWQEVLRDEPQIDVIVRGEGEATTPILIQAIENGGSLSTVSGIAYRDSDNQIRATPAATMINLDDYRIGWELIDFEKYSYWGDHRAVVVQFSRGCPR